MGAPRVLARAVTPRGEVLLRERFAARGPVYELIVNGVFAMDSSETSSERELAHRVEAAAPGARRVLVGGLGLGYTAAAVLDLEPGPAELHVVELEADLVAWARAGLTPVLHRVAEDPRTRLHVGDVVDVLTGGAIEPAGRWDAVLLDVDNGPDFLIHEGNALLYTQAVLRAAYQRLAAGGVLAVWCQGAAPDLLAALQTIGSADEQHYGVARGQRDLRYAVYSLHRPAADALGPPSLGLGHNDDHG